MGYLHHACIQTSHATSSSVAQSVTITGSAGTMLLGFSFDAPVVSWFDLNRPTTGGGSMTFDGMNFGNSNYTPTAQIKGSMCGSTSWVTYTQIRCTQPHSFGRQAGILNSNQEL